MSVSCGIWSIGLYCHFWWCFFTGNIPLFWAAKAGQIACNCSVSSSWGKEGSEEVRVNPIKFQGLLWILAISLALSKVVWSLWLEGGTRWKLFRMSFGSNICTSYTEKTVVLTPSDRIENKPKCLGFKTKAKGNIRNQRLKYSLPGFLQIAPNLWGFWLCKVQCRKAGTDLIIAATVSAKSTETREQLQVLITSFFISPISKNWFVLGRLDEEMEADNRLHTRGYSILALTFCVQRIVDAIKTLNSRKQYTVAGRIQ